MTVTMIMLVSRTARESQLADLAWLIGEWLPGRAVHFMPRCHRQPLELEVDEWRNPARAKHLHGK